MIDASAAEKVLQADLANIVRKVKGGKPLSKAERELLARQRAKVGTLVPSAIALAERLGVDRRTLNRWAKEPGFPKKNTEGYDVDAVREWVASNGLKTSRASELNEEKKRVEIEKIRLEIDIKKGLYLPKEEVVRDLGRYVFTLKTLLQTAATTLAPQVVGLTVPEALERLRQEHHEILRTLSESAWLDPSASSEN
jgi:hypothetical protein